MDFYPDPSNVYSDGIIPEGVYLNSFTTTEFKKLLEDEESYNSVDVINDIYGFSELINNLSEIMSPDAKAEIAK